MKGYVCRSKGSNKVCISCSTRRPKQKSDGWFWYIPGWFTTVYAHTLRKKFNINIKEGEYKLVNISISESQDGCSKN